MNDSATGFLIGNVRLEPVFGNIEHLHADAFVQPGGTSSNNTTIHMSPWALEANADELIGRTLMRHAPFTLGDVIVTPAGTLNAKYLFTAIVMDWGHQHPSGEVVHDDVVVNTARKCIAIAAALGVRSIAFTPWGTRATTNNPAQNTAMLLHSITGAVQEQPGQLEIVYLVSNQLEHYQWFVDRVFVFKMLYQQISQVRAAIHDLDIPGPRRAHILNILDNIKNNIVVYNEIVAGDKIQVADITNSAGVAIGKQSVAKSINNTQG
jgi:O-acetyl-ADP-ribose deacetylase (regulator of RNase III)